MNDNTILRIKVPAHLYESVKEQLTINEAAKAKAHYGAGMELVKEKKMKTPKDGMHKVEEADKVEETNQIQEKEMEKKHRSLDELKKAKEKLEARINEMESAPKDKVEEGQLNEGIQDIITQIISDPANAYDILKAASKMTAHEFEILVAGISTLASLLGGAAAVQIKSAINKVKGQKAQA